MTSIRTPWRAVSAMFILNGALFGIWASRVPAVAEQHRLGHGALGILLLLMAVGAIIAFTLAGRAVDRFGAHKVTWRVAVAYSISLFLLAFAPGTLLLGAALLFFGAVHGAMDVGMNTWAGEVERRLRRPVMSSFHAMFSLGAGLGASSGYLAVKAGLGIQVHFLLAGAAFALVTLSLAYIEWIPDSFRSGSAPPIFSLPNAGLLAVGFVAFCASLGEGAMADWGAIFLVLTTGATEADAALGYAAFSITMVIMRLMGDRVIQVVGRETSARLAGIAAGTGVIIAVTFGTFTSALVGFALMGIGYAVIMPLAFTRAANDPIVPPGIAIASVATLGYGGMLLGPPLIGFVAEVTSLRAGFLILAALALLVAAMARAIRTSTKCEVQIGTDAEVVDERS
ncbi:MAG: MFS transporter [Rhizobiaceae bacterium]